MVAPSHTLANIQDLLSNLQRQITTVSNMANSLNNMSPEHMVSMITGVPSTPPPAAPPQQDLSTLVKTMVAAELAKQGVTPAADIPTIAASQPTSIQAPVQVPEIPIQTIASPIQLPTSAIPTTSLPSLEAPQFASPTQLAAPEQLAPLQTISNPNAQTSMVPNPPNIQDAMMKDFLNQLKMAIGGGLSPDQQIWVSSNLFSLPEFFKSNLGRDTVGIMVHNYKQYLTSVGK